MSPSSPICSSAGTAGQWGMHMEMQCCSYSPQPISQPQEPKSNQQGCSIEALPLGDAPAASVLALISSRDTSQFNFSAVLLLSALLWGQPHVSSFQPGAADTNPMLGLPSSCLGTTLYSLHG